MVVIPINAIRVKRFSDPSAKDDMKLGSFNAITVQGDKPLIMINYKGGEHHFAAEVFLSYHWPSWCEGVMKVKLSGMNLRFRSRLWDQGKKVKLHLAKFVLLSSLAPVCFTAEGTQKFFEALHRVELRTVLECTSGLLLEISIIRDEWYFLIDVFGYGRSQVQSYKDRNIENYDMHGALNSSGSTEIFPTADLLHHEVLYFMIVARSTQLFYGPSPEPRAVNFILDGTTAQEKHLDTLVAKRLLLNTTCQPRTPVSTNVDLHTKANQSGNSEKVGSESVIATYRPIRFNLLVNTNGVGSKNLLTFYKLHVLLFSIHYLKYVLSNESMADKSDEIPTSNFAAKVYNLLSENPHHKALYNLRDMGIDGVDLEGNTCCGLVMLMRWASLYDTLAMCFAGESIFLRLYSLVHGNSEYLENACRGNTAFHDLIFLVAANAYEFCGNRLAVFFETFWEKYGIVEWKLLFATQHGWKYL